MLSGGQGRANTSMFFYKDGHITKYDWTGTTHEAAVYMHNVQKIYVLHLQV